MGPRILFTSKEKELVLNSLNYRTFRQHRKMFSLAPLITTPCEVVLFF